MCLWPKENEWRESIEAEEKCEKRWLDSHHKWGGGGVGEGGWAMVTDSEKFYFYHPEQNSENSIWTSQDGGMTTSNEERKAEMFHDFFLMVFTDEDADINPVVLCTPATCCHLHTRTDMRWHACAHTHRRPLIHRTAVFDSHRSHADLCNQAVLSVCLSSHPSVSEYALR